MPPLDARHTASIYPKLVPILGDEDTNVFLTALAQRRHDGSTITMPTSGPVTDVKLAEPADRRVRDAERRARGAETRARRAENEARTAEQRVQNAKRRAREAERRAESARSSAKHSDDLLEYTMIGIMWLSAFVALLIAIS